MRITFTSQIREGAAALERAAERLAEFQRQVASGRRLGRPSDDPAGASTAVAERAHLAQVDRYTRTADTAAARLAVMDAALSDLVEQLTAAQSTVASVRGSEKTQAQRDAAAEALVAIKKAIAADLNTAVHGSYLFAGAAAQPPFAVDSEGNVSAYAGSATEVAVDIGDGRAVTVAVDGTAVVGSGPGTTLFETFDAVIAAVRAGDAAAMGDGLAALKAAFERAVTVQTRLGLDLQAVDTEKLRLQQVKLSTTARLSEIEDADVAQAVTSMTQADTAYRAALGAIATARRVSLFEYLK